MQNTYRNFLANCSESKEARKVRKAEIAEAKRLAKKEAALARAEAKANKKKKAVAVAEEDKEDENLEDDRKPSLLRGAPTPLPATNGSVASKTPLKKKRWHALHATLAGVLEGTSVPTQCS